MKLRRLEIENFRGVRRLDWRHISATAALVGPGDAGKSTILDAIERVLSPRWNVAFDDTDFWNLCTDNPLILRATVSDFTETLLRDSKFGLALHAFSEESGMASRPRGGEGEVPALVIELRVDASLEPTWNVVDAEGTPHPFAARDREALGVLRVGSYVDQHLGWGRGSVLTRLTEGGDAVGSLLAGATRQARDGLRVDALHKLAEAAQRVEVLGKNVGASFGHGLGPHLDASALAVASGALSLHDGKVPARRAGLGTRRLLAVAMQRATELRPSLTIVDEFENGLEPHRIRRLLRVLRGRPPEGDGMARGQLILTTHAPTVLHELEPSEIAVTRRTADGNVRVESVPDAVGYVVRRTPQALLARKVIVAEGKTEVGLCHALDDAWSEETGASFAYRGIVVVDGGGSSQPAEIAGYLARLGYDVALLIDSDGVAKVGKATGAQVLAWPDGYCTEQRLATDLPAAAICEMTKFAARKGGRGVRDAFADQLRLDRAALAEDEPASWPDSAGLPEFRPALGRLAKKSQHGWFKSFEGGGLLGNLVTEHWAATMSTPTGHVISKLRTFVHG